MKRTWKQHGPLAMLLGLLLITVQAGSISAQVTSPVAAPVGLDAAVAWLVSQQGDDGAFIGFTGEPDAGVTVDAVLALAAARHAGIDTTEPLAAAISFLASGDVALVYAQTGTGQSAKLVLALYAAGENPEDFANVNPVTLIEAGFDEETGLYGTGVFDHALAILGLSATGHDIPQAALDSLEKTQAQNGGWAFDGSVDDASTDSNTTALVVQALIANGQRDSELVERGLAFLDACASDAGVAWNNAEGGVPDANSTGVTIQALVAADEDMTPLVIALSGFQNTSGAFHYNADDTSDNLFATLQAVPAIAEVAFPIAPIGDLDELPLAA